MSNTTSVLRIDSSARGSASVSKQLTQYLVDQFAREEVIELLERDLGEQPLAPIAAAELVAVHGSADPVDKAAQKQLALSDTLVAELMAADVLVIGAPMYNFGVAATLKAWVDHICRARVTFRYTDSGPQGLTNIEHGFIVVSTGGTRVGSSADFVSGYLRQILKFIGVRNVHVIHADGSKHSADEIVANARGQINTLLEARRENSAVEA
ncbi:MAG: ACP phosphodiesterase [Gammaproteobacteria bacterium]|nr:ACP phosphodiesterase [Gammaproteobacteria bacterium]